MARFIGLEAEAPKVEEKPIKEEATEEDAEIKAEPKKATKKK